MCCWSVMCCHVFFVFLCQQQQRIQTRHNSHRLGKKKKDEQAAAPTTGKKKKWSRLLTRLLLLLLSVQFSQRPSPFPSSHIFHGKPCPVELRSSIALPLPFYSPTHLSSSHSKYFPLVFLPVFHFLCYQKTKSMPKAKCTGETERPRDKETWDRTEREHDTKGERVRLDKQGRTGWRKRERAREGGIWSGEEGELDHGSSNFLTIQFQTNTNTPPHLTPSFPFLFPFLSSPLPHAQHPTSVKGTEGTFNPSKHYLHQ